LNVETIVQLERSVRDVCFEKGSKADADACLLTFAQQNGDVADQILGGSGSKATPAVLTARKKVSKAKATLSFLGERHLACMKAATTLVEKDACITDLDAKRAVAGVTVSKSAVLKAFRANQLAEAATVCSSTDRKACIESAKQDMIATGMKARKFNMIKRISEFTSTAEVYSTCKQSDGTDQDCMVIAKEEFQTVSGADDATWTKLEARITKLATAIQNGEETLMKKKAQVLVEALTSGTVCDNTILSALLTKVRAITVTPSISGSKEGACRMVDSKAEYSALVGIAGFTESQTETAADALNTGVEGQTLSPTRRLAALMEEVRRLAAVSTAYASQETEACGATDTTCGQTDASLLDCSNYPSDPACQGASTTGATTGATTTVLGGTTTTVAGGTTTMTTTVAYTRVEGSITVVIIGLTKEQVESASKKSLAGHFGVDETRVTATAVETRRLGMDGNSRRLAGTWTIAYVFHASPAEVDSVNTKVAAASNAPADFKAALAAKFIAALKDAGVPANVADALTVAAATAAVPVVTTPATTSGTTGTAGGDQTSAASKTVAFISFVTVIKTLFSGM